ncbi:hypothetical protein GCM10009681_55400 [Luedemannella helvata]|uniref:Glucanase n=2 Tax=Luedemannella helvata TaxID=349315 RepID=A0ABP4XC57_9ACTN
MWLATTSANAGTLSGTMYRDPDAGVMKWVAANPNDSRRNVINTNIASQPAARWFANVNMATAASEVGSYINAANAAGQVPVMSVYGITNRDCGGASSGGAPDLPTYNQWVRTFAPALGSQTVIIILETDSLALLTCLDANGIAERNNALSTAVRDIKAANGNAKVYLDGGHSAWNSASEQANRLRNAGIQYADGFYTNVSNFQPTSAEASYGNAIINALNSAGVTGKRQIIDTSRNGGAAGDWCADDNTDRRIGQYPTLNTGNANIDGYIWVKPPGEADGCAFTAGSFQPTLAYSLANGVAAPSSSAPTTRAPVTTSAAPTTRSASTSLPPVSAAPRVDNPFVGGKGYVNPEWSAKAAAEPGGTRVSNQPTAVWLDRIAAIEGTANSQSNGPMGLEDHLDAAVAQGATYAQFVIYNLPGRDCSALASNGELKANELSRYKAEYIDPIAAIQGLPKFRGLRIINVIEVDSLPNLVTNTNLAACAEMKSNGAYVDGIAYALNKLGALSNVYNYVDAAHHGWIGWDSNSGPTAELMYSTVVKSGSVNNVAGFITNTANYSALSEPYVKITDTVNGTSVRQAKWFDWNMYADELTFAQAFRNQLIGKGFPSSIGMLIDTSRNGWGGSARPTGPGPTTSVDAYVNGGRIDRRIHAGNWCNQSGAGLGERPTAAPASGIDAYVWIKPPGESDGSSSEIPNSDGKGFDRMCDPTYTGNDRNGNSMTGALANAPISGAWFSAQFRELMANAYPPLDGVIQTSRPPTSNPPTSNPPTSRPPTSNPPTSNPPTSNPPTSNPPTSNPPTSRPPTSNPPTSGPPVTGSCSATYKLINSWPGGFQGEVTVKAGSSAITSWRATWTLPSGQTITQLWSGQLSTSGSNVTVTNMSWNGSLAANATTTFGFLGAGGDATAVPTVTCT